MNINLKSLKCVDKNIDLDKYIDFREHIKSNMAHPEWLGDFTKEEMKHMLSNNSKIWIYYLNGEQVCSMMFIPADEKALKKFGVDLAYEKVAEYGPMMVDPKFVGNGLQYQMLNEINKYSINNKYKYAVGTIHPDNVYSINNFLKDGFKVISQKEFERGIRDIYIKKL